MGKVQLATFVSVFPQKVPIVLCTMQALVMFLMMVNAAISLLP